MTWMTKTSLNRWCLRTLREACDSLLHRHLHGQFGTDLLSHPRQQGRPPLRNACIAPHCPYWEATDDEHGICRYRQALSDATRGRGH